MKNFSEYSAECAMDFIEAWEGCRLTAYKCPAGVWTIGSGHTSLKVVERPHETLLGVGLSN